LGEGIIMQRSRGFRSKTRKKLSKGRFSIAEALQDFSPGDVVLLSLNPAVHSGMPHPKFHGFHGIVKEKRGRSFVVEVKDKNKAKIVTSRPEHLRPLK